MKKLPTHTTVYGAVRTLRTRPFLRGPIGWEALKMAVSLGGKALAVYLACQHKASLCKSRTFRLSNNEVARMLGTLKPLSAHRNLAKLEQAGLIHIERPKGCKLRVTLTDMDLDVAPTNPVAPGNSQATSINSPIPPSQTDGGDRAGRVRRINEWLEAGNMYFRLPGKDGAPDKLIPAWCAPHAPIVTDEENAPQDEGCLPGGIEHRPSAQQ